MFQLFVKHTKTVIPTIKREKEKKKFNLKIDLIKMLISLLFKKKKKLGVNSV